MTKSSALILRDTFKQIYYFFCLTYSNSLAFTRRRCAEPDLIAFRRNNKGLDSQIAFPSAS